MALAQIDNGLKSLEAAYAERLHRWQEMTAARIAERVRLDSVNNTPSNIIGSLGIGASIAELTNDLVNLRTRIANFGRGQVNEELKRQEVTDAA